MAAPLSDTDPETERVHLELLHSASVARRVGLAFSISASVIDMARRAIRKDMPAATEQEVGLEFVARHYGAELAADLGRYLSERRPR